MAAWRGRGADLRCADGDRKSTLLDGLRATGGKFFVCAGALFICWALAASILAIGPSVAETLLGMHQRGVFGYAIAVYLLIAGISQILSRRLNARHSLLFGCLAQVLAAVVFAAAINGIHCGWRLRAWWWPAMLTAPFSSAARPW